MTLEYCIEFANKYPDCAFATCDRHGPHVRYMTLGFADTSGFYFNTMISKALYRQVVKNPKVELCFHRDEPIGEGAYLEMLRVHGTVEILDDPDLFPRFIKKGRYFGVSAEMPRSALVFFRIKDGEVWIWYDWDELKEEDIPKVKF